MKIVGLISSPNKNGSTAVLVREALKGAEKEGATVSEIYLPEYRIEFCAGCSRCMSEGRCCVNDDFEKLKAMLYSADGIIVSSPTYAGTMSAMLKRFLERLGMYERFTSHLGGKYFAGMSTCSSMGAVNVAKGFSLFASAGIFKRGYFSGHLGVSLRGDKITDNKKALGKAYRLGRKVSADIKNSARYPLQNIPGRLLNSLIMKPMMTNILFSKRDGFLKGVYNDLKQREMIP